MCSKAGKLLDFVLRLHLNTGVCRVSSVFILSAFVSRMLVTSVIISLEGKDDEVVRELLPVGGVSANWNYVTSCLCPDSFAMRL